jgi:hypothetical protein
VTRRRKRLRQAGFQAFCRGLLMLMARVDIDGETSPPRRG